MAAAPVRLSTNLVAREAADEVRQKPAELKKEEKEKDLQVGALFKDVKGSGNINREEVLAVIKEAPGRDQGLPPEGASTGNADSDYALSS